MKYKIITFRNLKMNCDSKLPDDNCSQTDKLCSAKDCLIWKKLQYLADSSTDIKEELEEIVKGKRGNKI